MLTKRQGQKTTTKGREMTHSRKYDEIRRMSREDRREIFQFAMQRSSELLAGIDKLSADVSKSHEASSICGRPAKSKTKME